MFLSWLPSRPLVEILAVEVVLILHRSPRQCLPPFPVWSKRSRSTTVVVVVVVVAAVVPIRRWKKSHDSRTLGTHGDENFGPCDVVADPQSMTVVVRPKSSSDWHMLL